MNKKGQMNTVFIAVLVMGLLFGGFTGAKLSSLNPFKSSKIVERSEGQKQEYFKDTIKGYEYRYEEKYKNQAPSPSGGTVGQKVGNWVAKLIDTSLTLIIIFIILGFALLYFTGINIFKKFINLNNKVKTFKKSVVQTVAGIEVAKSKMNGEKEILKAGLDAKQDNDVKTLIDKIKNGEEI